MPTPFEAGKTAKELGIDTSRKFVVVNDGWAQPHPYAGHNTFRNGDLLAFLYGFSIDNSTARFKRDSDGAEDCCLWSRLAYADDETEPAREEERLLGYDTGKEGGDETVALYGKRHEDGSVEITKTVRGLPLETPYEPRVGDRVVMEAVVMMVTPDLSGPQLVVEHKRNDGEKLYIKVFASDMYLLSREIRSLTKIRSRSLTHGEAGRERED